MRRKAGPEGKERGGKEDWRAGMEVAVAGRRIVSLSLSRDRGGVCGGRARVQGEGGGRRGAWIEESDPPFAVNLRRGGEEGGRKRRLFVTPSLSAYLPARVHAHTLPPGEGRKSLAQHLAVEDGLSPER